MNPMAIELSDLENGVVGASLSNKRNSKSSADLGNEIISEITNKFGFDEPPPKTPESG